MGSNKPHGRFGIPEGGLRLTPEEQLSFINKIQSAVTSTIHRNEDFLENGRPLPKDHWKFLRENQGMKAFKEIGLPKGQRMPTILCVGIVPGTLDDVMYSSLVESEADWRWRSHHTQDFVEDQNILAHIIGPTEKDPYQTMSVNSFVHRFSIFKTFVDPRDFLVVGASGMARDSQNRRVGYLAHQSVDIPRLVPLDESHHIAHFRHEKPKGGKMIRANLSSITLFRQFNESLVEVYSRASVDCYGKVPEGATSWVCAETHLSFVNFMDMAHVKKLRWVMGHHNWTECDSEGSHSQLSGIQGGHSTSSKKRSCAVCTKTLGKLIGRGSYCQICKLKVCSRCSTKKNICMDASGHNLDSRAFTYCSHCMLKVGKLSARKVALAAVASTYEESLKREMLNSVAKDTSSQNASQCSFDMENEDRGVSVKSDDERSNNGRMTSQVNNGEGQVRLYQTSSGLPEGLSFGRKESEDYVHPATKAESMGIELYPSSKMGSKHRVVAGPHESEQGLYDM